MTNEKFQIGRLALREEGDRWVAYYAHPNTMEIGSFLGSIHMGAIRGNPERKKAFMDMMRGIVSDIIEEATGQRPTWGGEKPAPEKDRGVKPTERA